MVGKGEVDDDDYQWLAGSLGIPQPDKRATLLYPQITITQLCHVMMWMITMMMIVTALTMTAIFVLPYFDRSSQSICRSLFALDTWRLFTNSGSCRRKGWAESKFDRKNYIFHGNMFRMTLYAILTLKQVFTKMTPTHPQFSTMY